MKKDQFIPHDVTMRTNSEIMRLIQKEGIAGYGIYWAMMEYLRTQDDYTGDVRVFGTLARQLRTSPARLKRILHDYGLFEVTGNAFQSCKLNTVMRPLENKRKAMEARSCDERATNNQRELRNSLETKDDISLSKGEARFPEDETWLKVADVSQLDGALLLSHAGDGDMQLAVFDVGVFLRAQGAEIGIAGDGLVLEQSEIMRQAGAVGGRAAVLDRQLPGPFVVLGHVHRADRLDAVGVAVDEPVAGCVDALLKEPAAACRDPDAPGVRKKCAFVILLQDLLDGLVLF